MLNLEVFQEPKQDKQKSIFLKLEKDEDGDVILTAVDEKGDQLEDGKILYISRDCGKLYLCSDLNPNLGFLIENNQYCNIMVGN